MTRETKIGLLVGLAFIIVIGILLSDHLTTSTEPTQASLASAGNIVRSAVTTPGSASNPPITVVTPGPIAPQQAVPTPQDVAKVQPVQPVQVAVGGPAKIATPATLSAQQPMDNSTPNVANAQATDNATADNSANSTAVASNAPANSNDVAAALRNAAQQHGEEIVPAGGSSNTKVASTGNGQQTVNGKQYVAVEGDTFWKIVARQMGTNNKANRDAFLAANPSLKNDPNKIFAGHTYIIPTNSGLATSGSGEPSRAVALSSSTSSTSSNTTTLKSPSNTLPAATAGDNWYTIKSGDTLTTIAEEQCGTAQAVSAIVELNKDTLKDPNRIIVNTKIRLPNKPVAEAN